MKLKNRITYARKRAQPGDIRVVKKFALFPVVLDNDKTSRIWLESYQVIQIYTNLGEYRPRGGGISWCDNWQWTEDSRYPLDFPIKGKFLVTERRRIKNEMRDHK